MAREIDIKKSDFIAQTSMLPTDYLDFVRNGQNFRVLFTDFLTALGVSGILYTVGEPTGTPVLYQSGGVNYIRNIIDGSGITAALSPQNGLKISHNFSINSDGAPIIINETAIQPTVRSIQAGTGITVAGTGGVVRISTSGTPGTTKTVLVYALSDFPAPVGGIITLEDDTEYRLLNDVSILTNRIIWGSNTILTAVSALIVSLTYTDTGTMITCTDNDLYIKGVELIANSGTLIVATDSTGLKTLDVSDSTLTGSVWGSIGGFKAVRYSNVRVIVASDGLTFSDNVSGFLFEEVLGYLSGGANDLIDLGSAVFYDLVIDRCLLSSDSSGNVITGLVDSGNITLGGLGSITQCNFYGTATALNNIYPTDDLWDMLLIPGVPDSADRLLATHPGATLTIAGAVTPVIIGATWSTELDHRFTATTGGRFTYNGKGAFISVTASISADIASGTDDCSFFLYKNGSQIANSKVTREFTAGNIGNISILWELELETDDYIEVWAQNDDSAANIIISSVILRAKS